MLWFLASSALAAGTTPEDRVELYADTGVFTGQFGVAFGVGAGWRAHSVLLQGIAGVGGRADLLETGASDQPGFGLGTAALTVDGATSGRTRTGVTVELDTALLDDVERDCRGIHDCRHGLFVPIDSGFGLGFQPAAALRIAGTGASGATFAAGIGLQPHWRYGTFLPAPRLDLMVALGPDWSMHAWAGRYGGSLGIGRTLSRPRR